MRRLSHIGDLAFRHNAKPGLGVEIFRLAELYGRFARRELPHALDAPQRLEFHIAYVGLRGRGQLVIDFAPVPLGAGWLTIVARGQVQQFVTGHTSADAWMLMFSPEFLAMGAREVDPLRGAAVLAARAKPALAMTHAERRELIALCELIHAEHARPLDAVQPAELAALLRAVLLRGERMAASRTTAEPPAPELARFFTTLERDAMTTRSVAHYARAAGVSARRLGELLVAHAGRSTKQLIDERVALEAKRLLAHSDLSVKELADRTGFAEPTNFVKFFRHHAGTTPLAFRARFYHPAAESNLAARAARR